MGFASVADRDAIENEMPWEDRDVPKTVWGLLSRTVEAHARRPAVTFQMFSDPRAPAETLSWAELQADVARTANLFRALGVGETDVVAYLLPNTTETVLTYIGGLVAGIVNPINPLLEAEQIAAILRETNAKVLVTLRAFPRTDVAQKAARAVELAPNVQHVVEIDLLRYLTGAKRLIVPLIRPRLKPRHKAEVHDFRKAIAAQPATLAFPDSPGDRVAAYFHTGGTTGLPKVAQHRYQGIIYNAWVVNTVLLDEDSVAMCPLPMFHVFAAIIIVGGALSSGAHIIFPTPQGYRGDGVFDNFWKLCERYKVTFVIGVPTAISRLMQRAVDADLSALRLAFSGSSPLPVELYKRFEQAAGIRICEAYGLTEATCGVSTNPPDGEKKIGSVGIALPYSKVKIFHDTSDGARECDTDEVGEILRVEPRRLAWHDLHRRGQERASVPPRAWRQRAEISANRRSGADRPGRLYLDHRPGQGPDHPGRAQYRSGFDRGCAGGARQGRLRRRHRPAGRPFRRAALRLCRARRRRGGDGGGAARLRARPGSPSGRRIPSISRSCPNCQRPPSARSSSPTCAGWRSPGSTTPPSPRRGSRHGSATSTRTGAAASSPGCPGAGRARTPPRKLPSNARSASSPGRGNGPTDAPADRRIGVGRKLVVGGRECGICAIGAFIEKALG